MHRVAFKMKLLAGYAVEYKKRHDALWPELQALLKEAGVSDYSIFLDDDTNTLFAYLTATDTNKLAELSNEPVMKKWWLYMRDIMETNADNSPVVVDLKELFFMP